VGFWVTYFVEAGGQHVFAMAQAEELGIRVCLMCSTIDNTELGNHALGGINMHLSSLD
jgi:hypothetical protein